MKSKRLIQLTSAALIAASFAVVAVAAEAPKAPKATTSAADAPQATETKATNGAAPRLTVVEPLKDYGTIPKGEILDWSFTVKNTGSGDLQILSAQPSCGCTVADFDKVIKPGQTGKVTAHVDTKNFSGPISKAVTIQTNDPNNPTAQLTLHAVVRPYIDASPAGFVRYMLLQGEKQTQSVVLFTEEEEPFEIKSVEAPADYIKVDYKKVDAAERVAKGRDNQPQYKFDITVGGPTAKLGPLTDKIKVVTNSKHSPEFFITVNGLIRPTYMVTPTVLNFGDIKAADAAATRTIVLQSNEKNAADFKVTKVEPADSKLVATSFKPADTPGQYEVTVKLANGAKAGALDTMVKIYTNDKLNPVQTVPVKGNVKTE